MKGQRVLLWKGKKQSLGIELTNFGMTREYITTELILLILSPPHFQLFDKCLAPDSLGDGTGCDNMTCVIVHLHGNRDGNHSNATIGHATKRTRDEEEDQPAKKPKVAEAEVANIPESVVSSASV